MLLIKGLVKLARLLYKGEKGINSRVEKHAENKRNRLEKRQERYWSLGETLNRVIEKLTEIINGLSSEDTKDARKKWWKSFWLIFAKYVIPIILAIALAIGGVHLGRKLERDDNKDTRGKEGTSASTDDHVPVNTKELSETLVPSEPLDSTNTASTSFENVDSNSELSNLIRNFIKNNPVLEEYDYGEILNFVRGLNAQEFNISDVDADKFNRTLGTFTTYNFEQCVDPNGKSINFQYAFGNTYYQEIVKEVESLRDEIFESHDKLGKLLDYYNKFIKNESALDQLVRPVLASIFNQVDEEVREDGTINDDLKRQLEAARDELNLPIVYDYENLGVYGHAERLVRTKML